MATLRRIPVAWTTGPGGAGVSVFYSLDPDDPTGDLGTFFNAIKGLFPPAVTWQVPSAGDTIESTTGALVGAWTGGTGSTTAGSLNAAYAAGTGAYVRWVTGAIRNGRKFKGRTFLCPITAGSYQSDGTIDNTLLAILQTASSTLAATGLLRIWGRPIPEGASNGFSSPVLAGVVPDKVTSLRSRRS